MNKIKKAAFGVLIAGLAFGFSAFNTVKKRNIIMYYKTDPGYPNMDDPRGYQYFSDDRCMTGGNTCSSQWDIGENTPPTNEGELLPTTGVVFQEGSAYSGHFE